MLCCQQHYASHNANIKTQHVRDSHCLSMTFFFLHISDISKVGKTVNCRCFHFGFGAAIGYLHTFSLVNDSIRHTR